MAVRIGGQAVIEGVMMKNMDRYAVSVRKPNGKIETKVEECVSFAEKHPLFQLPVFRGMANFLESMVIGMKTLNYSASFYEDEEEQTESRTEQLLEKILGEKAEKIIMGIVLVFSLAISIGLFMILPYIASEALGKLIRNEYVILFMEGIIRIAIFLGYIVLISRMEDIKRVFMYHGAEHKTINCLEAGVPLTPENVDNFSRLHKRCGTSFIFIVMIISMVFFFFIRVDTIWLRIVLRLLFLPLVAGVSYEFIRLAGSSDHPLVQIFSKPGLALQRLTTKEPDHSMIEVAIASVEGVFDWREYLENLQ
jgi:Predicted metal-dependent enzyme